MAGDLISLLLIIGLSVLVVLPSRRRAPGLGVLFGLVVVGMAIWLRPGGVEQIGLRPPAAWTTTIFAAAAAGLLITGLTIGLLEPIVEHLTRSEHDWSLLARVRESWPALLQILLAVWLLVAPLEEVLFRGFLMTELRAVLGSSFLGLTFNLLLSSVVFSLAHSYQGRSGVWSTGIVGLILGGLFVLADFNLWLPLLCHGFIDTFSLLLMRLGWDRTLREAVRLRLDLAAPVE